MKFTSKQLQVLENWAESSTVEEAAEKLDISHHTFLTHLKRMRQKLGVKRTFDVYKYVRDKGLI